MTFWSINDGKGNIILGTLGNGYGMFKSGVKNRRLKQCT